MVSSPTDCGTTALKGFEHDIKWVPKVMEPVAREAFRRIRAMTESRERSQGISRRDRTSRSCIPMRRKWVSTTS